MTAAPLDGHLAAAPLDGHLEELTKASESIAAAPVEEHLEEAETSGNAGPVIWLL